MIALIEQHRTEIAAVCRKYQVQRLELFGSAVWGDFDPLKSDLDFLVDFEDLGWKGSSKRYFGLLHGLEDLFAKRIDLVEPSAVTNPYFRQVAFAHRELVYAAPVAKAS